MFPSLKEMQLSLNADTQTIISWQITWRFTFFKKQ